MLSLLSSPLSPSSSRGDEERAIGVGAMAGRGAAAREVRGREAEGHQRTGRHAHHARPPQEEVRRRLQDRPGPRSRDRSRAQIQLPEEFQGHLIHRIQPSFIFSYANSRN